MISVEDHPSLRVRAFTCAFPAPLGTLPTTDAILGLLRGGSASPFAPDEQLRTDIRDMLRHGGYRPTGRGKPSSEYLVRAASEGKLESINLAVDACNASSLHGGFPISVVDLGRAREPFMIAIAPPGSSYVFNRSGQEIDVAGLVCLHDAEGPCANAVKDAQRTKTDGSTTRTLSVIWGAAGHDGRLDAVTEWYRALLAEAGVGSSSA